MPTTGSFYRREMVGTGNWRGNCHKIQPFSASECNLHRLRYNQSSQDERTLMQVFCLYYRFRKASPTGAESLILRTLGRLTKIPS